MKAQLASKQSAICLAALLLVTACSSRTANVVTTSPPVPSTTTPSALTSPMVPVPPTVTPSATGSTTAAPTPTFTVTTIPIGPCHSRVTPAGTLPDSTCTPGATNPMVTQSTISTTICKAGWTATVRPPLSYTAPRKIASIKAYGYTDTNTAHYEMDHLIPLELGGAPTDTRNLWAEPGASPNGKDASENKLKAEVCGGQLSLAKAQHWFATDWTGQSLSVAETEGN